MHLFKCILVGCFFLLPSVHASSLCKFKELGQASHLLEHEDYLKLSKAILIAENALHDRWFGINEKTLITAPVKAECTIGQCGRAFSIIVAFLSLQGTPLEKLHFIEMRELLKGSTPQHYVLALETTDSEGKQNFILPDITLNQFPFVVDALKKTKEGREIIDGIEKEGFWIATEAHLEAYRKAMGGQAILPVSAFGKSNLPGSLNDSENLEKMKKITRDHFNVEDDTGLLKILNKVNEIDVHKRIEPKH